MSIKLLMLRNGEEVISEVKEICEPETDKPLGYHMHKPFRLDIVTAGSNEQGYQLEWFPWAPLSKDKDFFLPGNHVVTVYEPLDALVSQYVSAIDEARYEENFRKHEARFNLSYEDLDLNDMFDEAEKMLNEIDDDGNTTTTAEDGSLSDKPSGDT
tara:strand:- start:546 stop:1013 length:468 start_codon:yes stop_codon:yes gene_type:complete